VYVCTPLRICKSAAAAGSEAKDKKGKKGIGQKQDGKAAGKRTRDPADKRSERE
jgi:hypothetical protein